MKRATCAAIMAGLMWFAFTCGAVAQTRAVGIGVADLEASTQFYQQVLGLEVRHTYELGYLNELVFDVEDATAVMARLHAAGGAVVREVGPIEALPGVVIGLGRDLDNYVIELISRQ